MTEITGTDLRDDWRTAANHAQMTVIDSLMQANGVTWDRIAFEANEILDDIRRLLAAGATEQQVIGAVYSMGFLSGLADGFVGES